MHISTPRLTDSHSGSGGERGGGTDHVALALNTTTVAVVHEAFRHRTCSTTVTAGIVPRQPLDGTDDALHHRSKVGSFGTGASLSGGFSAKGLCLHRRHKALNSYNQLQ